MAEQQRELILSLRNVSRSYGRGEAKTVALREVDLDIYAGDFVVILGKSGSGKTTLLNIMGLLDTASQGQVSIAGRALESYDEDDLAKLRGEFLGFIFQFHHLLPDFDVLDNALMPCRILGRRQEAEARERVIRMLVQVGLEDKLDKRPNQLSGGQRQRVAVVRAFANDPRLVLADEPTGSLDSRTTAQVLELLQSIQQRQDAAMIMVTHDEAMTQVANRIVELHDGRIIDDRRQRPGEPMISVLGVEQE